MDPYIHRSGSPTVGSRSLKPLRLSICQDLTSATVPGLVETSQHKRRVWVTWVRTLVGQAVGIRRRRPVHTRVLFCCAGRPENVPAWGRRSRIRAARVTPEHKAEGQARPLGPEHNAPARLR